MTAYLSSAGRGLNIRYKILMTALMAVFAVCAWLVGGPESVVMLSVAMVVLYLLTPRVSPRLIMRWHRARPLSPSDSLHRIGFALAERAGLRHAPELYLTSNRAPVAFSVGDEDQSAIALSVRCMRLLTRRELAGVLAHETAHIANGDSRRIFLIEMIRRMIGVTAFVGLVLLVGFWWSIPGIDIPGWVPLVLLAGPSVAFLLQCAISRTAEHAADLRAVTLTHDARALASALAKIDQATRTLLERLLGVRGGLTVPTLLQSHPRIEDRLERLLAAEKGAS